eukprot:scaffold137577_cov67-Attheya_sp.AAC.4
MVIRVQGLSDQLVGSMDHSLFNLPLNYFTSHCINRENKSDENGEDISNEYAEDEDVPMNLNGPEQGGATTGNIINEEGGDRVTTRGFIRIPVNETNRSVNEQIHDILRE